MQESLFYPLCVVVKWGNRKEREGITSENMLLRRSWKEIQDQSDIVDADDPEGWDPR